MSSPLPPEARDFDFLFGDWRVRHRKLKRRLAGSDDWMEFEGAARAQPILGGLGNFDEFVLPQPDGRYMASTVRFYAPKTGLWSIYWIDGRDPKFDTPVRGRFADGVGEFYSDETFEGRPIRLRFLWSDITPSAARWAQAFSPDGGETWETNWTMDFQRA